MVFRNDKEVDDARPGLAEVLEALGIDTYGWPDTEYGGWKNVRCPFHDDKRASATVNMREGAFNCNACDVKGDVWSIIMGQKGLDFRGAVQWATNNVGYAGNRMSRSFAAAEPYKPSWLD